MNRLPAEWERHDAILMSWPHEATDWAYMIDEARKCFIDLVTKISRYEHVILVAPDVGEVKKHLDIDNITIVEMPTNDTWARDFGPITVESYEDSKKGLVALDYKFNGWGLKFASCFDNLITRRLHEASRLGDCTFVTRQGFVLEGGSIDSNGGGTILTTEECLLSPNRNAQLSKDEIEDILCRDLGAKTVIWLKSGAISGDDTDSHIDTLARFTDKDTIAYVAPPADSSDADYASLSAMEKEIKELPFRSVPLPYAGPLYDVEGNRVPATYANFLITPRAVFMPSYGLDTDSEAREILASLFTDREIVTADCTALIQQHGSLHCVTMQLILK